MKKVYIIPNRKRELAIESAVVLKKEFEEFGCVAEITEIDDGLSGGKCADGDLLVALGGDGTVIGVASRTSEFGVPTAGVNCGHVGYMTCMEAGEKDKVKRLVDGDFTVQNRIMLEATVIRENGDTVKMKQLCLNDAVITNGPIPRLLEFDLFSDNRFVEHFKCDGVIIATPTGSSAYNMSAGGPILDPELNCLVVTPICPQQLYSRPSVFSANSVFEIKNAVTKGTNVVTLSLDGREKEEIFPGDVVRIVKSEKTVSLVSFGDDSFLRVLYSKLSGVK